MASRIGACRADIVGIEVLEVSDHVAVDEFAVTIDSENLLDVMLKEITEVDGVTVESVIRVEHFPDSRTDGIASAAALLEARDAEALHHLLLERLQAEFALDWVAIIGAEQLVRGSEAPTPEVLSALATGATASASLLAGETGPDDLAVAQLESTSATVLGGRNTTPFRRRERAQIRGLAEVADRCLRLITSLQ